MWPPTCHRGRATCILNFGVRMSSADSATTIPEKFHLFEQIEHTTAWGAKICREIFN